MTDDDAPLLRRLFEEGRPDLGLLPDGVRQQIVDLQLQAQRRQQEADHPGCRREVLLYDGAPVGLLVTDHDAATVHVVDIAIAAEHRGRGLGTAVLGELQDHANAEVALQVWADNTGARRLYERLGFRYDEPDQPSRPHQPPTTGHLRMRWRPRPDQEG